MIYFTSNTHFGHKNIIKYANRPFSSIEEMDNSIIDNWNTIVSKKDIIFHLGDFCFGNYRNAEKYFNQLNGKIFILNTISHHDNSWLKGREFFSKHGKVTILPPIHELNFKTWNFSRFGKSIVLCHFPLYVWNKKHYNSWHLHGHSHDRAFEIPNSPLSMNVSVECNDYSPFSLDFVMDYLSTKEKNKN